MRLVALPALILLFAGCAAELRPAPSAKLLPGPGHPALAEASGVRLVAQVDQWRGRPANLAGVVTPLLVTIENESSVPLRIRHTDFALTSADGARITVRPPHEIRGAVADPSQPFYGLPRTPAIAARDPSGRVILYDTYPFNPSVDLPRWDDLPTGDMVQLALPERVLEPHGRLQGFIYLPLVKRDQSPLDLSATLIDDRSGSVVTTLHIPFVVE